MGLRAAGRETTGRYKERIVSDVYIDRLERELLSQLRGLIGEPVEVRRSAMAGRDHGYFYFSYTRPKFKPNGEPGHDLPGWRIDAVETGA